VRFDLRLAPPNPKSPFTEFSADFLGAFVGIGGVMGAALGTAGAEGAGAAGGAGGAGGAGTAGGALGVGGGADIYFILINYLSA
jgi:hypothetical protein